MEKVLDMRNNWYDNNTHVFIEIIRTNKMKVLVECLNRKIYIDNILYIDNLCEEIEKSSFESEDYKITITLKKINPLKWRFLTIEDENKYNMDKVFFNSENYEYEEEEIITDYSQYSLYGMLCDLYKRGTDEQKRAMKRSIHESNMTIFSNNIEEYEKIYSQKEQEEELQRKRKSNIVYPLSEDFNGLTNFREFKK